jgi:hypothetical protein
LRISNYRNEVTNKHENQDLQNQEYKTFGKVLILVESNNLKSKKMADKILKKLNIKVWRQNRASEKGKFETYSIENISTGSSFLEMMDILNNELIEKGS